MLLVLNLGELDKKDVVELGKVLLHVVDSYTLANVVEHGVNAAIELSLPLAELGIVDCDTEVLATVPASEAVSMIPPARSFCFFLLSAALSPSRWQ